MPTKKKEDLRIKSVDELKKHAIQFKRELMNMRFQKANGNLDKTHKFRQLRRDIARVKTIINEQLKA